MIVGSSSRVIIVSGFVPDVRFVSSPSSFCSSSITQRQQSTSGYSLAPHRPPAHYRRLEWCSCYPTRRRRLSSFVSSSWERYSSSSKLDLEGDNDIPVTTTSSSSSQSLSSSLKGPLPLSSSPAASSPLPRRVVGGSATIQQQQQKYRSVKRLQSYTRLPVWPIWNGIFIWMVEQILGRDIAAELEDAITGRVCPNFFDYTETSPFVMLVHHCHSFARWDPWRYIQATFFPEGFPAHPHRGFITLTYVLDGGFVHRDSVGIKQRYGGSLQKHGLGSVGSSTSTASTSSSSNGQSESETTTKHTQWLHTGSGMLHEEMFDNNAMIESKTSSSSSRSFFEKLAPVQRQELYQLWINVPAQNKWTAPMTRLLGGSNDETPLITADDGVSWQTLVLAGKWNGSTAAAPIVTPMCILHVQIAPGQTWTYPDIPTTFKTMIVYVRKGSGLQCLQETTTSGGDHKYADIPVHHMAFMETAGQELVLYNRDLHKPVDFLLLAGEPITEPFFASGSMVMNTPRDINQAYYDYQMGLFGRPWDHKLTDAEWLEHVKATTPPSTTPKDNTISSAMTRNRNNLD